MDKYDFQKMAEEVSDALLEHDEPLNKSIKVIAIKLKMNPEQIKRLSESANVVTYNRMFDSEEDKTFKFDLADSKKVISDVYDNEDEDEDDEYEDDSSVEIKDMPPTQYEGEESPMSGDDSDVVLGDENETSVSKGYEADEAKSGDPDPSEAYLVPNKDYSDREEKMSEESKKEDNSDFPEQARADKADEMTARKEASFTAAGNIRTELDSRILLLGDKIFDEYKKAAFHFTGLEKQGKFDEFANASRSLYKTATINEILANIAHVSGVKNAAHGCECTDCEEGGCDCVDCKCKDGCSHGSDKAWAGPVSDKVAMTGVVGSLLELHEEHDRLEKAHKYLEDVL